MAESRKRKTKDDAPGSPKSHKSKSEDTGSPEPSTSDPQSPDGVWIFVDNSNLWIECKKAMGGEQEEPKGRVDVGKLASFLSRGRKIINMTIYGSRPPPNDTLWEISEKYGWKVVLSDRSAITGKEKQVDTKITVDVCKIVEHKKFFKQGSTIILVSGDGDMTPVTESAMEKNWNVEICGLKNAMSRSLYELEKRSNKKVRLHILDGTEKIFYREERFHINDERGVLKRSIVLIGCKKDVESKTKSPKWLELRKIINEIDMTWKYDWLRDKKIPGDNLVIKFSPNSDSTEKQMDFDVAEYISELTKKCIPDYCQKVISHHEYVYGKTDNQTPNIPVKNRFAGLMDTD